MAKQASFAFRKGVTVGNIEAELDGYLREAFIDRGDLGILQDTRSPKSIVVGRTGAGKSALLLQLEHSREHVIRIRPDALSLQYLSNSTILPNLAKIGIRLDLFYL